MTKISRVALCCKSPGLYYQMKQQIPKAIRLDDAKGLNTKLIESIKFKSHMYAVFLELYHIRELYDWIEVFNHPNIHLIVRLESLPNDRDDTLKMKTLFLDHNITFHLLCFDEFNMSKLQDSIPESLPLRKVYENHPAHHYVLRIPFFRKAKKWVPFQYNFFDIETLSASAYSQLRLPIPFVESNFSTAQAQQTIHET